MDSVSIVLSVVVINDCDLRKYLVLFSYMQVHI